jgi:two-component system, OmpR family, alkaline phosphatase synthesis response regulator PhoP
MTKPFSVRELVLRIKRTLERWRPYREEKIPLARYEFGERYWIDFVKMQACTNDGIKELTIQEANILLYLIQNEGKIVSRKNLLENIWGYNPDIETRTVDNFIVRFRKYFETGPLGPKHFVTKRGLGYLFQK